MRHIRIDMKVTETVTGDDLDDCRQPSLSIEQLDKKAKLNSALEIKTRCHCTSMQPEALPDGTVSRTYQFTCHDLEIKEVR